MFPFGIELCFKRFVLLWNEDILNARTEFCVGSNRAWAMSSSSLVEPDEPSQVPAELEGYITLQVHV